MQNIDIQCSDCLESMKDIKSESVDLVITSPPYDDIKNYNNSLNWNFNIFTKVANNLYRILKNGGCIIWVVADKTEKGSESCTSFKQAIYFKENLGLNLHDTMIYKKLNYVPLTHNRYEQEFEYIFCFSKGKPKTFNPIKIPCKYAGTQTWGNAKYYKTSSDDLTTVEKYVVHNTKIKGNIFEYRVGSTKTGKIKHPAMFPLDLAVDQIKSWSNEGDIILDPFMGSGTTGVACINTNRNFIGIEIDEKYFNIAKERIEKAQNKWGDLD